MVKSTTSLKSIRLHNKVVNTKGLFKEYYIVQYCKLDGKLSDYVSFLLLSGKGDEKKVLSHKLLKRNDSIINEMKRLHEKLVDFIDSHEIDWSQTVSVFEEFDHLTGDSKELKNKLKKVLTTRKH